MKNISKARRCGRDSQARTRASVEGRICHNLRGRLYKAIKRQGLDRAGATKELLGCTCVHLKTHLESLFLPGMSWKNYGKWHIDHIVPCSVFDLTKADEQKKCFHFSNLRPLWAFHNLKKGGTNRKKWIAVKNGYDPRIKEAS